MLRAPHPSTPARQKRSVAALHFAFVLTGLITTMLGPLLPALSSQWRLSDVQAGGLFFAQFIGAFIGSLLASALISRWSTSRAIAIGLTLDAAGACLLLSPIAGVVFIAPLCYGLGIGITVPAATLCIADVHRDKIVPANALTLHAHDCAASINLLNFSWTAGAVASGPLFALLLPRFPGIVVMGGLAALLITSAAVVLLTASPAFVVQPTRSDQPAKPLRALVLLTGLLMVLYVGVENSIAGWLPSYLLRTVSATSSVAAGAQSAFWSALLAGRLLAPLPLRRLQPVALVQLAAVLALASIIGLLAANSIVMATLSAVATGASLSVIFPTAAAVMIERLGDQAVQSTSFVFAISGLGGAILAPLVGVVSARTGSLRTALFLPLLGALAILAAQIKLKRLLSRTPAEQAIAAAM